MPKITELDSVISLDGNDVLPIVSKNNNNEDETMKIAVNAIGTKLLNSNEYGALNTTDKKIIGAINEVNTKASQFDNMTATASGSIATFTNGGDDIPASEFECEIVAQQASGTPTPDNPLPITGWSSANVYSTGKNFVPMTVASVKANNTLGTWSGNAYTFNNVVFTLQTDIDGNITGISANGTANATSQLYIATNFTLQKGSYILNGCPLGGGTETARLQVNTGALNIDTGSGANFTLTEVYNSCVCFIRIGSGYNPNGMLFKPMVRLASDTDTFVISKTNIYTVAFGQTIYGGRLIYDGQWSIEATFGAVVDLGALSWTKGSKSFYADITGAKLYEQSVIPNMLCEVYRTVSYNDLVSEQYNEVCSINNNNSIILMRDTNYATASDFATAVTGKKAIFELATPVIIPITSATRVKTISGDNKIYSNTGDCELKYFTNKADSLAELIKAFVL